MTDKKGKSKKQIPCGDDRQERQEQKATARA
jgi:hypothetical protein